MALTEVMDYTAGLRPGDLMLIAGFASEGKSFMSLNDGHSAWLQGKNVAVANGEMSERKYRNRFYSLHSQWMFEQGLSRMPIPTTKIDRGTLEPAEHEVYLEVLEDIKTRREYGKFFVFQFPYRATPSIIFNRFSSFDQIVPLDFVIVDYLGLLASDQRRVQRREELDDLIREVKALALDFGDGRSIPVQAGFQTNRQSFEKARSDGYYTLSCFAEASEAEKSADAAMWLLSQPNNPGELKAGFIKNRDDELGEPFYIKRNLKYAQLSSLRKGSNKQTSPTSTLLDL